MKQINRISTLGPMMLMFIILVLKLGAATPASYEEFEFPTALPSSAENEVATEFTTTTDIDKDKITETTTEFEEDTTTEPMTTTTEIPTTTSAVATSPPATPDLVETDMNIWRSYSKVDRQVLELTWAIGKFLENAIASQLERAMQIPDPSSFSSSSRNITVEIRNKLAEKKLVADGFNSIFRILNTAQENMLKAKTLSEFLNVTLNMLSSIESSTLLKFPQNLVQSLTKLQDGPDFILSPLSSSSSSNDSEVTDAESIVNSSSDSDSGPIYLLRPEMWTRPLEHNLLFLQQQIQTLRLSLRKLEMVKAASGYPFCGRLRTAKAFVFPETNFGSAAQKISYDSKTDGECKNLPSDWAKSINTRDTCIRLYINPNCRGNFEIVEPWTLHHNVISNIFQSYPGRNIVPKSIGPCWAAVGN